MKLLLVWLNRLKELINVSTSVRYNFSSTHFIDLTANEIKKMLNVSEKEKEKLLQRA